MNDAPEKYYMAEGKRDVQLGQSGDTVIIHFTFQCEDTRFGDRVFASLLGKNMTADLGKLSTSSRATLELTHRSDTSPVARGWTIQSLATGDTADLAVTVSLDTTTELFYAMESDREDSIIVTRKLRVQ